MRHASPSGGDDQRHEGEAEAIVDRLILSRKLTALESYLQRLRGFQSVSEADYCRDWTVHELAERSLHLACECVLDIANHLISDQGLRLPSTNRESFRVLTEGKLLEPNLAARMEGWASFRNALVHLYLDIDHGRTWRTIQTELRDLEEYLSWASGFL